MRFLSERDKDLYGILHDLAEEFFLQSLIYMKGIYISMQINVNS